MYNFQGGSSGGYKFRRDGTGGKIPIQVPGDGMFAPMVWGDWVYYVQSNYTALKRVRTDGAVVETLVEVSDKRKSQVSSGRATGCSIRWYGWILLGWCSLSIGPIRLPRVRMSGCRSAEIST